ncbi:MAG: penicillin-binding protein 2 [Lachnospiraceae bacterium]|nr:penicillin-binding protein 2 [Lachnospiraceae bacterium]
MIANLVWFVGWKSDQVINSSYNRRETVLAERVVRGSIYSMDGEVLARTETDEDGEEHREYPFGEMFCHVVGRTEKGKTGIESSSNLKMLYSHDNGLHNAWEELLGNKTKGDNVVTTLSYKLQKAAYDALGDKDGVVVALEPDTGKILCMVSKPDYDPNKINELWEELSAEDSEETSLLNRATQGLYPPGSTFKVMTTLAFLRQKSSYRNFVYNCEGTFSYRDVKISCYNQREHGTQTLTEAFANSCNSAFAKIGSELNWDEFSEMCKGLYFNQKLPANVGAAMSKFDLDGSGDKNLIPQTSIGQGDTLMTPLHNAMIAAAVANGGVLMKPYLIDHYESSSGTWKEKVSPEAAGTLMSPEEVRVLTECMRAVVSDGTASKGFRHASYRAAGKTGSAEYNAEKESHAWFIGFAPYDDPSIAVCVIVEGGGSGGTAAVPIAKEVFDAWLDD